MSPPRLKDGSRYNIRTNSYWQQFDAVKVNGVHFARRTPLTTRKKVSPNLFIIEGDNGVGKSHYFKRILPSYGITVVPATPHGNNIGEILIEYNDKNVCILLDDANNIYRSQATLETINKATDTDDRFIPSCRSMRNMDDGEGCLFLGRIVMSTYLPVTDFKKYPGMQSIMSRVGADYINIRGSKDERYHYACYLATEDMRPLWREENIAPDHINEVLNWFAENKDLLKEPSPRTLKLAILKRKECASLAEFIIVARTFLVKNVETGKSKSEWRHDLWRYEDRPNYAGVGEDFEQDEPKKESQNKKTTETPEERTAREGREKAEDIANQERMEKARKEARGKSQGFKKRTGKAWLAYIKKCDEYVEKNGPKPSIPTVKLDNESDGEFALRRADITDKRRKWDINRPEPPEECR